MYRDRECLIRAIKEIFLRTDAEKESYPSLELIKDNLMEGFLQEKSIPEYDIGFFFGENQMLINNSDNDSKEFESEMFWRLQVLLGIKNRVNLYE